MNNPSRPTSGKGSQATPGQPSSAREELTTAEEPRKRRRPITDAQRKDLRDHKQNLIREYGKWTLNQMVDFFEKKYDRVLNNSTISDSLSDTFKHLDETEHPIHPDFKKKRKSYWPDLEAAVFDWEQQALKKKTIVTNEALKAVAKKLFHELPQYRGVESPKFSDGWVAGYRARFEVNNQFRVDKSGVPGCVVAVKELEDLSVELKDYRSEDIYNMDETALSWKMSPEGTPATQDQDNGKLEEASITVGLACNVTGTHKLPLWIIGKAQTPRCFDRSCIQIQNFPIVWQHNGKALMTGPMFEEYLQWFDTQLAGRKVCLLIDQISAHGAGIIFLNSIRSEGLENTKIVSLPTNITSVGQPLDPAIIQSWKAHYRKRWLAYMCNEYDANRDPMKSMNVLKAIRWAVAAWENDVTPTTIRECWIKSRVLGPKYAPGIPGWKNIVNEDTKMFNSIMSQMVKQIAYLRRQKHIKTAMDITKFVSPVSEVVDDSDENSLDSLVEIYASGGVERDHETDEEDEAVAPIQEKEALKLLSRLRLYEEQQVDGDMALISRLNNYERTIKARAT